METLSRTCWWWTRLVAIASLKMAIPSIFLIPLDCVMNITPSTLAVMSCFNITSGPGADGSTGISSGATRNHSKSEV